MSLNIIKLATNKEFESDAFMENIDSKLMMDIRKNEIEENNEWIDEVNFSIQYIEKALNKPIKNIVTEEEVVKIEKIKKVTVESIKHLSKHTDLINDFDQKTGQVTPSKILNAFKEESLITYENRFVYSLIKLIDDFIFIRTSAKNKNQSYKGKNYQKATYEASTKIRKEKIKVNFEYEAESVEGEKNDKDAEQALEMLIGNLKNIKSSSMFQFLDSKRIILVKSPLKMTNVLLKNVNFQYCVKLWNYLSDNFDIKNKASKLEKNYEEKGITKKMIDEDFFLKYIIFNNINLQVKKEKIQKNTIQSDKEKKELTEKMIEKLIQLNPELAEQELKKMIANKYIEYKKVQEISLRPLERYFKKKTDRFLTNAEKNEIN